MNTEKYQLFCQEVRNLRAKYPYYREGIILYNALCVVDTNLADQLHNLSPFHNDDKIPAFLDAIADRASQLA